MTTGRQMLTVCGYLSATMLWIGYVSPFLWATLQGFLRTAGEWGPRAIFTVAGVVYLVGRVMRTLWMRPTHYSAVAIDRAVQGITTSKRAPERLARVARHEAAHATVVWALGGHVSSIDVLQQLSRDGQCAFTLPSTVPLVDQAWIALVSAMAGNHVDLAAGHHDFGASSDVASAVRHAACIISTGQSPAGTAAELTSDSLLAAAQGEAQRLLERHAPLLDAITEKLLENPTTLWPEPDLESLHRASSCSCF